LNVREVTGVRTLEGLLHLSLLTHEQTELGGG